MCKAFQQKAYNVQGPGVRRAGGQDQGRGGETRRGEKIVENLINHTKK